MKWLFLTLVLLNIVVFASMIASKMVKQHMPVANAQQVQPVVINMVAPDAKMAASSSIAVASGVNPTASPVANNATGSTNGKTRTAAPTPAPRNEPHNKTNARANNSDNHRTVITNDSIARNSNNDNGVARAKYKECSARVSLPEDDYHRIKGLLGRYPHAASRQVVDNGNGESAARMNVVFMQVSDQEASAIQGVVGRYGQLNRAACNR